MSTILVTGATGNIGRELLTQLAPSGAGVRALTRDAGRAVVPPGVELVEGDLTAPGSVRGAFAGVDALFLVLPGVVDVGEIVTAATDAGVKRVVLVSSLLAQTHPDSFIGRAALAGEQVLRDSGAGWTVLRPWEFASNVLAWAPAIRERGVVRVPFTGNASPAVHPGDIAAVGAAALVAGHHDGRVYPLTGPQELTPHQKLRAAGDALGRELVLEEDAAEPLPEGLPDEVAQGVGVPGVVSIGSPGVLSTVRDVTGAPGRSFEQWAAENVAAFR